MSWLNKKNIFSYLPLIRGNQNNISLMYVQLLTIKLHKFVEHFFFIKAKEPLCLFSVLGVMEIVLLKWNSPIHLIQLKRKA